MRCEDLPSVVAFAAGAFAFPVAALFVFAPAFLAVFDFVVLTMS